MAKFIRKNLTDSFVFGLFDIESTGKSFLLVNTEPKRQSRGYCRHQTLVIRDDGENLKNDAREKELFVCNFVKLGKSGID